MGRKTDTSKLLETEAQDYGTVVEISESKSERKKEKIDASIFLLFKYATKVDATLMVIGTLSAIISGAQMPILGLFFGGMTNTFINVAVNGLVPNAVAKSLVSNLIVNATPIEIEFNKSGVVQPEIHNGELFYAVYYTIKEVFDTESPYLALMRNDSLTVPLTEAAYENTLNKYLIIFIVIGIVMLISSFIQTLCWEYTSERQVHCIRQRCFAQILRQDISWYDTNDNGNLPNKLADDVERIREGTGYKCPQIVQCLSTFVAGILVGVSVCWQLSLVVLCVAPFLIIVTTITFRFAAVAMAREQEKYAAAGAVAEEVLSNMKTVNAFGGQPKEVKRYEYWLEEGRKIAMKKYNVFSVCLGLTFFTMNAIYAVAFIYGSYLVQVGVASPGSVFAVFFSVVIGSTNIGVCLPFLNIVSSSIGVIASMHKIIVRGVDIDPYSTAGRKPSRLNGRIEFKNVHFAYPSRLQTSVLNGLNLKIEPSKQVAIVGSSGAGKSTIISLILRFYDTTSGEVCLDDLSVKRYNVNWLRRQIGLVSQEPLLFGESVAENIRYGFEHATAEEIVEAAKQANAHDFILKLPNGYETLVGDTGSQLSGGQRQRIAIARALVRDPKILLLDEATSALDARSEGIVQDALEKAMTGRTTIIVAHRLSTIRHVDTICVMQEGELVESGTHEELMEKAGVYYNLVQAQMSNASSSATDSGHEESASLTGTQTSSVPNLLDVDNMTEFVVHEDGGKGRKGRPGVSGEGVAPTSITTKEHSSSSEEEDETSYRVLDRQVSTNTVSDEDDDEYETEITTVRETIEILYEEDEDDEENREVTEQQEGKPMKLATIKEPEGDDNKRLYRRKRSSGSDITGEYKKGIPFQEPEEPEKSISFGQLMKMQKPEWPWLLMGVIGFIGTGLMSPIIAMLYGQIFKVFTLTGIALEKARVFWSYIFVGFAVYCGIAFVVQTKGMTEANEKLIARARGLVFENILKQPVGWFDLDASSPGILINRLARNAPLIKAAAGLRMGNVLSATVTVICSFVIAFVFGWKLALALAVFVPLVLFLYIKQQNLTTARLHKDSQQMDTAGRVASEAVRNIRTVQALGQEKLFTEIYSTNLEEPYREAKKRMWLYSLMYAASQGISFFMYAIAFRFGGYLIEVGDVTADNMYRVFFALSLSTTWVATMFTFIQDYAKARHSIKVLNYLLSRRSEIDSASSTGARPEIHGKIEFKNVHFSYPTRPNVKVLKGLKFILDPGKTLALVGESGCGKSTVVSLIERFYDPTSGGILVDDYDIRTLNIGHLRSKIGIVTQEPILFDTTIRENIAYGAIALQDEIPTEQILWAAKIANIHDFIMTLPERYETMVGERGVQLSGGQKQRMAIARALIRDPKILLLDEATSALDTESEKIVQMALDKAKQGRTCIVVAHRLSTIRNADTICVLHKGKIVERGTHDELQAQEGMYFQLTQRQSLL